MDFFSKLNQQRKNERDCCQPTYLPTYLPGCKQKTLLWRNWTAHTKTKSAVPCTKDKKNYTNSKISYSKIIIIIMIIFIISYCPDCWRFHPFFFVRMLDGSFLTQFLRHLDRIPSPRQKNPLMKLRNYLLLAMIIHQSNHSLWLNSNWDRKIYKGFWGMKMYPDNL